MTRLPDGSFDMGKFELETQPGMEECAGMYSDPNHPGCLRKIEKVAKGMHKLIKIHGSDQVDGSEPWVLDAVVEQVAVPGCPWKIEITADFSFKGGPSNCKGVFKIEHGTILWNKGLNGSEAVTWTKQ